MVGFLASLLRRFDRRHTIAPDSAKTYGNLVHGTACRNTDDFPGPAEASLIGRLMAFLEKGSRFREFDRHRSFGFSRPAWPLLSRRTTIGGPDSVRREFIDRAVRQEVRLASRTVADLKSDFV
jgi:hypothetical protein